MYYIYDDGWSFDIFLRFLFDFFRNRIILLADNVISGGGAEFFYTADLGATVFFGEDQ